MPTDGDLGPRLTRRLTYLLKRTLLDVEEIQQEYLAPSGIGARELAVLLLLDSRAPESQQRAGERLGVDRTSMVGLLDGLEAKGLVERQADPNDRRRNVVALTDTGRRTLADAVKASDRAERRALAALDPSEREQFRALLTRVASSRRDPT
ncbi:MarR family winged helix-turn-helix transcriptional regulator [Jatrophihabitans sp. YIM 134969]